MGSELESKVQTHVYYLYCYLIRQKSSKFLVQPKIQEQKSLVLITVNWLSRAWISYGSSTEMKYRSLLEKISRYKSWCKKASIDKNSMRLYIGEETIMNAFWRSMCYDCTLEGASGLLRRANDDERNAYDQWW